jgi:transposase
MSELTPALKHHILQQYLPYSHENNFSALAARYNVKGGRRTIQRWLARWDGTSSSLEHTRGAGRPRLLSAAEVNENIRAPILERNRSHHAVHYTDLVDPIRERTGKNVALRTIQRYGEKILRARDKTTCTRTEDECTYLKILR